MALDDERRRELGERLRELRGAKPQRIPAAGAGVTERTYGAWERGEQGIEWDHLEAIAEFYGVTTNVLLYGSETAPQNVGDELVELNAKLDQVLEELERLKVQGDVADRLLEAIDRIRRLGDDPTPPPLPEDA